MRYDPAKIEKKWQKRWLEEGTYEPDLKRAKRPFYNLMMFPYPSAEGLHIGSVRTFTGIDIYGRFKRMQGYDVFQPIGLDGFGIHSENYALKVGKHPMQHAKDSERNFYRQLGMIGNGFAWREKLETYDPEYYRWTQWIFVQMFKHGLAHRKKSPVNWCPSCKTVLADEQVLQGECERCGSKVIKKDLEQWFFKITDYAEQLLKNLGKIDWPEPIKIAQRNWIGKSEGALIRFPLKQTYNYAFLHAFKGSPREDFWPWLKSELEKGGGRVYAPQLPNPSEPNIEEQAAFLLKSYKFDENTVVITHSLGGVLAMKLLPKLRSHIAGLIMVAPPLRTEFLDGKKRPALEKATDWKFDFSAVREKADFITVIKDTSDSIVPADQPEEIARQLKTRLVEVVAQVPHFNSNREPAVLKEAAAEIEVFTTRPDTLFGATYMVVAPEHPLIKKQEVRIKNQGEVNEYIKKAKLKTEEERISEGKEKTGVELKGIKAINPANNEEIPVWVADYVLGNVGTGAIMAVPAHDQRDFEFAKKYKIPIRQVIAPKFIDIDRPPRSGKKVVHRKVIHAIVRRPSDNKILMLQWKGSVWGDKQPRTFIISGIEEGEDPIKSAEREIYEETGYRSVRFIKKPDIEIHTEYFAAHKGENRYGEINILYFELDSEERDPVSPEELRKHDPVWIDEKEVVPFINVIDGPFIWNWLKGGDRAYNGDGVLINSEKFNGLSSEKAKWEIIKFVGGEKKTKYRLRDWLISRQRYWGPPIPMIYCNKCAWQPVPEKGLPVRLPYIKNFRPTGTDKSPLATVEKFYKARCPQCRSWARRETDVSDTFLDSAWYYLRYPSVGDKKNPWTPAITKKWLPVDMYIGGAEHAVLHLLYVRFLAMAFYDWGLTKFEEPFKKFRTHGLITKDGAKMSKSRGNVVNPDEYIKAYGSDAIRMYLAFLAPLTQGGDFRDDGIKGITRFLERVWKLATSDKQQATGKDANFKKFVHKIIKKVMEDTESFQYNTAISALMILLNEFEENADAVSKEDIKIFLKLLAPFAPFIAEELWYRLATSDKRQATSIHLEPWPKFDPKVIKEDTFELVIQVNGRVRARIMLPFGVGESEAKKSALADTAVKKFIPGEPKKTVFVPNKLINFVM